MNMSRLIDAVFVPKCETKTAFRFNPFVNEFKPIHKLFPIRRTSPNIINDSAYSDDSDTNLSDLDSAPKKGFRSVSTLSSDCDHSSFSSRSSTPPPEAIDDSIPAQAHDVTPIPEDDVVPAQTLTSLGSATDARPSYMPLNNSVPPSCKDKPVPWAAYRSMNKNAIRLRPWAKTEKPAEPERGKKPPVKRDEVESSTKPAVERPTFKVLHLQKLAADTTSTEEESPSKTDDLTLEKVNNVAPGSEQHVLQSTRYAKSIGCSVPPADVGARTCLREMLAYRATATSPHASLRAEAMEKDTSQPFSRSWRSQTKAKEKPRNQPSKKLIPSENSWSLAQKKRRSGNSEKSDMEVLRKMKSILNKLTVEKFDDLYEKLIEETGISTTTHVEALMQEVFEKATTQHHFIDMYTHLCVRLNDWSTRAKLGGRDGSFKRILLNQCQDCFETDLSPPPELMNASAQDEAFELKVKYKTKMLGNIKFVGALLKNNMLAPRILIACSQVLMTGYTPEMLESLTVLITTTGVTFDTPQWVFHPQFCGIMFHIENLSKDKNTPPRIRYLLQDVLDLRARGWNATKEPNIRRDAYSIDHEFLKVMSKSELELEQSNKSHRKAIRDTAELYTNKYEETSLDDKER